MKNIKRFVLSMLCENLTVLSALEPNAVFKDQYCKMLHRIRCAMDWEGRP